MTRGRDYHLNLILDAMLQFCQPVVTTLDRPSRMRAVATQSEMFATDEYPEYPWHRPKRIPSGIGEYTSSKLRHMIANPLQVTS
jgi:hypothetical protein